MKYFTHNQLPISAAGTWGRGLLNTSYDELVARFGKPMEDGYDDFKSDAEWHIQWDDGVVGTIYNWKNGRNYLGNDGLETWAITEWSIGGSSPEVVSRIKSIVRENLTGTATALPLP
jgi:hypothetical protein